MAKQKLQFEESLAELEKIIRELESGTLTLDKMMERYENGVQALDLCRKILERAEKKIEILVKNADGTLKTKPFDPEEEK